MGIFEKSIFLRSRFEHNCLLSLTVMMTCVLIWIPQTIHFRYFTFVNYEHHKRKRNDVIGRIIITTTMAAVIVTAFYVLTHLQVRICLFPDSQGHSSIRCRPQSEFSFWQDKKIFWHSGRIPNSSFALRRNHSFSIIERVHPGFGNGEKQFVARGSPNDLKNAARLFFDAEGELLHSPNGPIVRERDDTSKRAFLFYKTKSEMNILNHSHTVNRPITAPEVSKTSQCDGRPRTTHSVHRLLVSQWWHVGIFCFVASKLDRKSLPFQLNIFYGSSENQIINSGKAFFSIVRRRNVRNPNSFLCFWTIEQFKDTRLFITQNSRARKRPNQTRWKTAGGKDRRENRNNRTKIKETSQGCLNNNLNIIFSDH